MPPPRRRRAPMPVLNLDPIIAAQKKAAAAEAPMLGIRTESDTMMLIDDLDQDDPIFQKEEEKEEEEKKKSADASVAQSTQKQAAEDTNKEKESSQDEIDSSDDELDYEAAQKRSSSSQVPPQDTAKIAAASTNNDDDMSISSESSKDSTADKSSKKKPGETTPATALSGRKKAPAAPVSAGTKKVSSKDSRKPPQDDSDLSISSTESSRSQTQRGKKAAQGDKTPVDKTVQAKKGTSTSLSTPSASLQTRPSKPASQVSRVAAVASDHRTTSASKKSSASSQIPPSISASQANQGAVVANSDRSTSASKKSSASLQTRPSKSASQVSRVATATNGDSAHKNSSRTTTQSKSAPPQAHKATVAQGQMDTSDMDIDTPSDSDNDVPSPSSTPPLMEAPSWATTLDEEEKQLFESIDRMILDAEYEELMDTIDRQIRAAEEKELMATIDRSITLAEDAAKPAGRVNYIARVMPDGSLQEEHRPIPDDPLFERIKPSRAERATNTARGPGSRVLELEDYAKIVTHSSSLPKFAGNTNQRILTEAKLRLTVVNRILENEKKSFPRRKLTVRLEDDPDDSSSVLLHCEGHPDLVKETEAQVSQLVSAYQDRTRRRTGDTRSSPDVTAQHDAARRRSHAAYTKFCEFYKDVKEIEYKGTGVHGQHVNKVMWAAHKQRFGNECDDNCECPSQLSVLTDLVVGKHISAERKKNPLWTNPEGLRQDESPTGFVNHFAPKYFPLLEKEFPDESCKKILGRLVLMWSEHKRVQRFGIKCSSTCPCKEGWELVFLKGRLMDGERAQNERIPKRRGSAATNASIPTPRSFQAPIAKKKDRPGSASSASTAQTYEIVYNSGEELGFSYDTDFRKDPVCKIMLVSEIGKAKDSRLMSGTVVSDAMIEGGGNMNHLRTHNDLKQTYEKAKQKGAKLRIRCINPVSESSLIQNITVFDQASQIRNTDLNSGGGGWKGSSTKGWAGGAPPPRGGRGHEPRHTSASAPRQASNVAQGYTTTASSSRKTGSSAAEKSRTVAPNAPRMAELSAPTLKYSSTLVPAQHRTFPLPIPSILKKSKCTDQPERASATVIRPGASFLRSITGPARSKAAVTFADQLEEARYFDSKRPSCIMAVQVSGNKLTGQAVAARKAPPVPREKPLAGTKELIDAVQHKKFRDIIPLLHAGAPPDARDEFNKCPKDYVKSRLVALEAELGRNPGNIVAKAEYKDFDYKRKLLSIFIEASSLMDRARYNRTWQRFTFKIEQITNVRLGVRGAEYSGSHLLDCRVKAKGEELPSMPLCPISTTIEWERPNRYSANYNAHLPDDRQSSQDVVISLYMGDRKKDNVAPILLGESVIPLSRFSASVNQSGVGVIEEELPPNDYLAQACRFKVRIERSRDESFMKRKRNELGNKLETVIEHIERLNDETAEEGQDGPTLSGHVAFPQHGNLSLLHAAVYLLRPDLVRKLLNLGADPAAPSDVGNARRLVSTFETMILDYGEEQHEIVNLLLGDGDAAADGDALSAEHNSETGEEDDSADKNANRTDIAAAPPRLEDPDSLPKLGQTWMARPGMRKCTYFNTAKGCRFGNKCHHLHVRPHFGSVVDDESLEFEFDPKNVSTQDKRRDGRQYYTSAYWEAGKENIIYLAERGSTVGQNKQGIYWYKSKEDAENALKKVVMVARRQDGTGRKRGHEESYYGPSRSEEHNDGSRKRPRRDSGVARGGQSHREELFNRLLDSTYYNNTYMQMFGMHLTKADWAFEYKNGFVTATLHSPSTKDRTKYHRSCDVKDGQFFEGKWWFKDEKSAKASAYVSLVESCVSQGILTSDLKLTSGGRSFCFSP